ncbi:hypothetical protein [Bacillus cereus]|uniref:hypothetical protein n=1 Tax=Bacillus cereus TaxID=1396 RepID=UPI00397D6D33
MEDKDVINHRLQVLESMVQQMANEKLITQGVTNALNNTIHDLNTLSKRVVSLEQKVSVYETK